MSKRLLILLVLLASASSLRAQCWNFTGSMIEPRRIVEMRAFGDRWALANGGYNIANEPMSECEVYDAATATWSRIGDMQSPRARHIDVVLPDGRIAAIAGQDGGNDYAAVQTGSVEIFDPSLMTWQNSGTLIVPRQNHTATLLRDSTILVVGGWNGGPMASCEIFDPRTGISTMIAPLFQARHDHQAVLLENGDVLVAGGRTGGAESQYLNEVEIYHPALNMWTVVDPMFQSRIIGSLVQFSDGSVLASGGRNSANSSATGSEVFDPATGHWTSTRPMLQPCHWQGGVLLAEHLFIISGGVIDANWATSTQVTTTAMCEWYDRALACWFYAPRMNSRRGEHGMVYLSQHVNESLPENLLLVGGGLTSSGSFTNSAEVLDFGFDAVNSYMNNQPALSDVHNPAAPDNASLEISNDGDGIEAVVKLDVSTNIVLTIVSTTGVEMCRVRQSMHSGENRVRITESHSYPSGLYFVHLEAGAASSSQRLVLAH